MNTEKTGWDGWVICQFLVIYKLKKLKISRNFDENYMAVGGGSYFSITVKCSTLSGLGSNPV